MNSVSTGEKHDVSALQAEAEQRDEDTHLWQLGREIVNPDSKLDEALPLSQLARSKMLPAANQSNDENKSINFNVSANVPHEYNAYYGDSVGF